MGWRTGGFLAPCVQLILLLSARGGPVLAWGHVRPTIPQLAREHGVKGGAGYPDIQSSSRLPICCMSGGARTGTEGRTAGPSRTLVLPSVVVGTFQLKGDVVQEVVREALSLGARAFDTASVYRNEAAIGEAIAESGVARSDIFLTSKLGPAEQGYDAAKEALRASLDRLQTDYVDLYLIHWPGSAKTNTSSPKNRENRLASWRALEEAQAEGLARHIGVSNFCQKHLEDLVAHARVPPAVNQVEFHAEYWDRPLRQYCEAHSILIQGYSPLGSPEGKDSLLAQPPVVDIAARLGLSRAQVLIKWSLQRTNGRSVVFRSSKAERLAENLAAAATPPLTEKDLARIDDITAPAGGEDGPHADPGSHAGTKYCWDPSEIA